MTNSGNSGFKLGINGLGSIGKLTVWHQLARKYFDEIVMNIGRQASTSLDDIAHYAERDSNLHCQETKHKKFRIRKFKVEIGFLRGW